MVVGLEIGGARRERLLLLRSQSRQSSAFLSRVCTSSRGDRHGVERSTASGPEDGLSCVPCAVRHSRDSRSRRSRFRYIYIAAVSRFYRSIPQHSRAARGFAVRARLYAKWKSGADQRLVSASADDACDDLDQPIGSDDPQPSPPSPSAVSYRPGQVVQARVAAVRRDSSLYARVRTTGTLRSEWNRISG